MKSKVKVIISVAIITILIAIVVTTIIIVKKNDEKENESIFGEYYKTKVASYAQENKNYNDYQVDIAFLGDSLTDGYDVAKYYDGYKVVNRGISGDTTIGLEHRLKVSVYDIKPKVVVMLIGINNLDTMLYNYENLLKGYKENLPDSKIIVLSLTPTSGELTYKNEKIISTNKVIKQLVEEYNYIYLDMYTPLLDESKTKLDSNYTPDGLHFNNEGYEIITNQIKPILNQIFPISVTSVELINSDIKLTNDKEKYIVIDYLNEETYYQLEWRVLPSFANEKSVRFIYDENNSVGEVNNFGTVKFNKKGAMTVYFYTNDISNVGDCVTIYAV